MVSQTTFLITIKYYLCPGGPTGKNIPGLSHGLVKF